MVGMLRARPGVLRQALFSALGLVPLGCGGVSTTSGSGDEATTGSAATSGGSAAAGAAAAGGASAMAGTSAGGASAMAGTSAGGASAMFACEDSMPDGPGNTGYERCANNVLHRVAIVQCPSSGPGPYTCVSDGDCPEAGICVCAGGLSYCAPASCRVDADCGSGFLCRGYATSQCGFQGEEKFACQTAEDTCAGFDDCESAWRCGGESGSFRCDVPPINPACGRPFLIDGAERVAAMKERSDWRVNHRLLDAIDVSAATRQRAAVAWARIAQLEHASIGAFARFTLQLLQLGAPAELVERASAAMRDETRHARLAFQVASECAKRDVGPDALDVAHCLEATSLRQVVELVMNEGCIGETVAALELREAAEHAVTPGLRSMLSRIADDETRHAELSWRFVRWALEQDEACVVPIVTRELEAALSSAEAAVPVSTNLCGDDQALLGLGIVSESIRRALHQVALREIIEPCARALIATRSSGSTQTCTSPATSVGST